MNQVVFLVDVDNTLLDNDRIQADIRAYLERQYSAGSRDRYWAILEDLFVELGYRDYLGALQRYRIGAGTLVRYRWSNLPRKAAVSHWVPRSMRAASISLYSPSTAPRSSCVCSIMWTARSPHA